MEKRESVKVLEEAITLQLKKSKDYQNENSNVKQAMHYRRGVDSIHDVIQGKVYRAQSLLESGSVANFESLEDTYLDIINYCSFAISYIRGKMDGQDPSRDMFNKPKLLYSTSNSVYTIPVIEKAEPRSSAVVEDLASYTTALLNPNATTEDFYEIPGKFK